VYGLGKTAFSHDHLAYAGVFDIGSGDGVGAAVLGKDQAGHHGKTKSEYVSEVFHDKSPFVGDRKTCGMWHQSPLVVKPKKGRR
jgi:hypothetical protein